MSWHWPNNCIPLLVGTLIWRFPGCVTKNPRSSSPNCSHITWQRHDQIIMPLRNVYIVEYVGSTTDEWDKKLGKIKGGSSFSNNIRPQMRTMWGRKTSARDTWEVHTEGGLPWRETPCAKVKVKGRMHWQAGCSDRSRGTAAVQEQRGLGPTWNCFIFQGSVLRYWIATKGETQIAARQC